MIGSLLTPGGLFEVVFSDFERVEEILIVIGGFIVIVQLIIAPDGIVRDVGERQAELGDLRTAVGIDEPAWRSIGRWEILGGLGLLIGLIPGDAFVGRIEAVVFGTAPDGSPNDEFPSLLRDAGSFAFDLAGWAAVVGVTALLVLAIRRHRARGLPWVTTVPALTALFLMLLHLRVPRILDPLFPEGGEGEEAINWAAWLGFAVVLVGALVLWVDSRRDHEVRARLPLWASVAPIFFGMFVVVSSFPPRVSEIVFGAMLGVFLVILGVGKVRELDDEIRLDYEIAEDSPRGRSPGALEVKGLTVAYGPVVAVSDLTIRVEPGQIVGLIGPNGAGKTTAIDAITGFTPATAGAIVLGGDDLTRVAVHQRSRLGLGRTFQTVEPFDDLTVAENLASATERIRPADWLLSFVRIPKLVLSAATGRVIDSFGLEPELSKFPNELPQGRRRLLGVARAMANEPSVLLLDEPAAGLDANETERLGEQLRAVATEQRVGMLLVEHDMSIVTAICDHVIALDFGHTIFSGPADRILDDPAIRAAYLGTADEPVPEVAST